MPTWLGEQPGYPSRSLRWTSCSAPNSGYALCLRPTTQLRTESLPMPEYQPSTSVHVTATGDGALVLLETRSGTMFRLNHTGATLWNALRMHGGDLSLAARTVAQRYGTPFHQVLTDTRLLATKLTDAGLLERTP